MNLCTTTEHGSLKLTKPMEKLISIYSHLSSWIGTAFVFVSTFFGDVKWLISYICIACVADLVCGIIRSWKVERKGVVSSRIVDFINKTLVYFLLFLCFVLIDKAMTVDNMWLTRVYTSIIIFSEIISMLANLSVSFPKIKAFSLVRKLIASEVAEKLKIDKKEVEDALREDGKDE